MNALDLTLLSVYRINNQELPLLPGLLAQNPPQKPARGRDLDRLLVDLTLTGNISYSPTEYSEIVNQVAETFYETPGSLTFALKTATSALNTFLVERNMKTTGKGLYTSCALVLCSLRGNSMYIVQAGSTHVYHLSAETRHLYDPELAGKGLGLSQNARMYFSQVMLSAGDRLLMCSALPPNWDKSLTEARGSASIEITRRRLLAITDTNVSALLVLASEGSGAMEIIKAVKDESAAQASPAEQVSEALPANEMPVFDLPIPVPPVEQVQTPAHDATLVQASAPAVVVTPVQALAPSTVVIPIQASVPAAVVTENVQNVTPAPSPQIPTEKPPVPSVGKPFTKSQVQNQPDAQGSLNQQVQSAARSMAGWIQSERAMAQKVAAWTERVIPRLLPQNEEDQPLTKLSRSWAIFFAVAVPVLFFLAARIVYFQLGYQTQFALYSNRAQQSAQQALADTSPSAARVDWQATLDWLDKADQYHTSPSAEVQKNRHDAQAALDSLDKVVRVTFIPAFDTAPVKSMRVSRISASDSEVYYLNSVTGAVLRGVYNGKNYDLDQSFVCGPGTYDAGLQVSNLIDIIALPNTGINNATLIAIDGSGNLLYCIPGATPHAAALQLPGTGWKGITAISFDNNRLYVLDAPARAVWIYSEDADKIAFNNPPKIFFGEQIPVMLEQAIDMVVNGDDLYLLHKDGHLATCTYSHVETTPTRCNDPALYIDTRTGYEGGINLTDGIFSQIAFTSAPNPAVALLEPYSQSIFRFSPRALELQNQLRANSPDVNILPKGAPITAMAFSPNKSLFVFADGQLYFSVNAP